MKELGRYNYVTPTSYLELIKAFKALLQKKQDDTMAAKTRYVVGLEKPVSYTHLTLPTTAEV